jgi:hypothetical protein
MPQPHTIVALSMAIYHDVVIACSRTVNDGTLPAACLGVHRGLLASTFRSVSLHSAGETVLSCCGCSAGSVELVQAPSRVHLQVVRADRPCLSCTRLLALSLRDASAASQTCTFTGVTACVWCQDRCAALKLVCCSPAL